VLVEALSVVVRNATLEALYPGGVSGYAADCPNRTFCSDGVLTRVGFMAPDDVGAFLERLETRGLVFLHDGVAADIAVVDQHQGPTTVCDWLAVGEDAAGIRCCWLRGSARGALATPADWTPEQRLTFVPAGEMDRRMTFVESRDGMDVWRDDATGREVYTGHINRTRADQQIAERLWSIGQELQHLERRIEQEIEIADPAVIQPLQAAALHLARQAEVLTPRLTRDRALGLHFMGLGYRVAADWDRAEEAFRQLLAVDPSVLDGYLELVCCLAAQGRHGEALPFAREAVRLDPKSPGALGNLALCLIHNGQFDEARQTIWAAVAADPQDAKNRYVLDHFDEYVARATSNPDG
jgi:hypothetical protein